MTVSTTAANLTLESLHHFTVEEFDRMLETGILTDEERVELLEGVLVTMTPIGDQHAACVDWLNELLSSRLSGRAVIRVQNPIALPDARPYPDLAVLRRRPDYYARGKPEPPDIYLIIEVADTALARDRELKLPLYGRTGVAESWIVDLVGETVIVGSEPGPTGYATVAVRRRGERLVVPGFPDVVLVVDEILGPPTPA